MSETRSGQCACGKIRLVVEPSEGAGILHCHCHNCRRITGNFVAAVRCSTENLTVDDPDGCLSAFDLGFATYGFCSGCGATLWFRPTEGHGETSVMAGVLDDTEGFEVQAVWFSHEAQSHHELPANVPHFEGNDE